MAIKRPSPTTRTAVIAAMLVLAVAGGGYALWHTGRVMTVASGFYAKILCSGVFLAGRGQNEVVAEDVLADMTTGLRHWHREVYDDKGLVEITVLGFAKREAIYRPGLGCTLANGTTIEALQEQTATYVAPAPVESEAEPWPGGSRVERPGRIEGVDLEAVEAVVARAFDEPHPQRSLRRTRAVVVVHKGRIVAERYAPGIRPDTPLIGWSMGKSVLNALVGILVADGRLKLDQDNLFPEWQGENDPRAAITVEHLLRMTSGLDFDEPHARMLSDVRTMLFLEGDSAAYARKEKLRLAPGVSWFYASGSTTLLASAVRDAVGGSLAEYFTFPHKALFAPLGMATAVIEPDAAGTFLMPAFVYASARDWARFGLLYLNDGVWDGRRILPEGWVDMSRTPTPESKGQYGAHLWLRIPDFLRPNQPRTHDLPDDSYFMLGHDGQMVAVIPSRDLVVVRLGLSRRRNAWDHEAFLHELLKAFK